MAQHGGVETLHAPDALGRFAEEVFVALGMRGAAARLLAGHLVWADLRGIPSLGLRKIPQYAGRLLGGGTPTNAEPVVLRDTASVLVVDCRDDWAIVTGHHVMTALIGKARTSGISMGLLRNASTAGALGYFADLAAQQGMIGMAITNSAPLQTPPGAATRTIGDQAFAIASPAGRHPPLVLDMATSAITLARIHEYESRGLPIAEGLALDASGAPTVDPAAALEGVLLPMAGHRGFGLALMWEILTGILSGGQKFAGDVLMPGVFEEPQGVSVFMLAIDPAAVMPLPEFQARVDALIDSMHATPTLPGGERVRVPGEQSHATAERRSREGIPLPPDVVKAIRKVGDELGVTWPG